MPEALKWTSSDREETVVWTLAVITWPILQMKWQLLNTAKLNASTLSKAHRPLPRNARSHQLSALPKKHASTQDRHPAIVLETMVTPYKNLSARRRVSSASLSPDRKKHEVVKIVWQNMPQVETSKVLNRSKDVPKRIVLWAPVPSKRWMSSDRTPCWQLKEAQLQLWQETGTMISAMDPWSTENLKKLAWKEKARKELFPQIRQQVNWRQLNRSLSMWRSKRSDDHQLKDHSALEVQKVVESEDAVVQSITSQRQASQELKTRLVALTELSLKLSRLQPRRFSISLSTTIKAHKTNSARFLQDSSPNKIKT